VEDTVGITAGTSTPDDVINGVARRLNDFAARLTVQTPHRKEAHELAA